MLIGDTLWKPRQKLKSCYKLVPLLPGNLDGFLQGDLLRILRTAAHPGGLVLTVENAKFMGAATCNAAQLAAREFLVVFELQPVHQTVVVSTGVHGKKEFFPVECLELFRVEAGAKCLVGGVQLGVREQFTFAVEAQIVLPQFVGYSGIIGHDKAPMGSNCELKGCFRLCILQESALRFWIIALSAKSCLATVYALPPRFLP